MNKLWQKLNWANRIYFGVLLLMILSLLFRVLSLAFRILLLATLSVFTLSLSAQQSNTYPRITITLHCSNAVTANNIWQLVTNRVLASDKFTNINDNRNLEITLRTNVAGSYSLDASYLFLTTNRAEFIWNYLTNRAAPTQTSGKITFHYCPAEGKIHNWGGCDTAGYRELKWP